MDAGGRRRREQAVEEARSRDGQEVRYAARGQEARSRDGQEVLYAAGGQEARSRDGQDILSINDDRGRHELVTIPTAPLLCLTNA